MVNRNSGAVSESSCSVCSADAAFLRSPRPAYEALNPRVRLVDLFCGCGGLSMGVAEAARRLGLGIEIPFAIDVDEDAARVYQANFPQADVRVGRVEDFLNGENGSPVTTEERQLDRAVGPIDVLVGGPPCQGHSDLNNHTRREDPRNALYERMARAARILQPSVILIENVPTVQYDTKDVVSVTIEALERAGYTVDECVIDLTFLGVPQRRRRHVVVASRHSEVNPNQLLGALDPRCSGRCVRTVRWAIEDLLDAKSEPSFDVSSEPSPENLKRMKWLFAHDRYNLPNRLRPACHASDHTYNSMYGRLEWDGPAQTITTGFGSMGQGRYVHPGRTRTITPHEAARLQMIPDFVDFSSVQIRRSLARLIGNAVPPVLASALIEPALRSLEVGKHLASTTSEQKRTRGRPTPSSAAAKKRMESTRRRDTAPELALRSELHRRGLRYLVDQCVDGTRRRADIVFRGPRLVVYVDGCFWHSCPDHATIPKENRSWWVDKLEANRRRDMDTDERLRRAGWKVLRFWGHEDPSVAAARIVDAIEHAKKHTQALEQSAEHHQARR
jgi:DNA (cytosine-5)-methyltransferase 1